LQPYQPTTDQPFDAPRAAHLLNRAGFGGKPEEISQVLELGPQRAVDWLLDFPDAGVDEESQHDVPDLSSIEGYPKTFAERRKLFMNKSPEERQMLLQKLMMQNREALAMTIGWWVKRMAYGPYPLQEKLTLFWHGHFTTSAKDERSAWLMWQQNEVLRANAAGNFGRFVKAISRDPAMLDYLNNSQNRKAHPNENYARELMELFTLGIGHYTEKDIKEAARALTGWAHDGDDFIFRAFDHDTGQKSFLGKRGNFDGDDVIDIVLQQPACAPYIARRMLTFFVTEEPDDAVCQSLGAVLRDAKYELRPVIRTMFTSKLFYSSEVVASQIKSPVQLLAGTIRLLDLDVPDARLMYGAMDQMGQVPMMPPNVKGWPGGRAWINTSTLFVRYNTAVQLAGGGGGLSGDGSGRKYVGRMRGRAGSPQFKPKDLGDSRTEIVDAWLQLLIQRPVPEDRRQVLVESVPRNQPDSEDSVKHLVQLIVSMPEYQLC
jgi:hypothetical protein